MPKSRLQWKKLRHSTNTKHNLQSRVGAALAAIASIAAKAAPTLFILALIFLTDILMT